ncbi:Hypp6616 [Branchiostoma lanceolatum]|uniref:Hypp6616 protein n=1 Tax=Branchiostoma lanceolatum TaxID=7740 RepID=A0A8J9YV89_BRALA|nr:Hypp6616 [Branchiostoma lanceolatum]
MLVSSGTTAVPRGDARVDIDMTMSTHVELHHTCTSEQVKDAMLQASRDIDIPLSLSSMRNLHTAVCDSLEGILEGSLAQNRGKYRHAMQLRGKKVEPGQPLEATAAADGCYNNPSFYGVSQRATQAALPVIETGTPHQMLIGEHKRPTTYHALKGVWDEEDPNLPDSNDDAATSSSSTREQGEEEEHQVFGRDVLWEKGVTIEKEDCTVHVSRGQRKQVLKLKLSPQIILGKTIPPTCKTTGVSTKKSRFCQV